MAKVRNINTITLNAPTYANNHELEEIDLAFVPWVNNSMYKAFENSDHLRSVTNINQNVTNMSGTFHDCHNLVNAPIIPNNVTNMCETFDRCYNLVESPVIPNSVTNMYSTFWECYNLTDSPVIPNSVTNIDCLFGVCINLITAPESLPNVTQMDRTFTSCSKLKNFPSIPQTVTTLMWTFAGCSNLVNAPVIPNNVRYIGKAFCNCTNLVDGPIIPNSANDIGGIFSGCINLINICELSSNINNLTHWQGDGAFQNCISLTGDIFIHSENITNATNCFYGTSLNKDVYIPFYYSNNSYTKTYNAFINAGYSTEYRVNGALLIDINDEGIDLSDYEYTNVSNDITLYNYIGSNSIITTPHLS